MVHTFKSILISISTLSKCWRKLIVTIFFVYSCLIRLEILPTNFKTHVWHADFIIPYCLERKFAVLPLKRKWNRLCQRGEKWMFFQLFVFVTVQHDWYVDGPKIKKTTQFIDDTLFRHSFSFMLAKKLVKSIFNFCTKCFYSLNVSNFILHFDFGLMKLIDSIQRLDGTLSSFGYCW